MYAGYRHMCLQFFACMYAHFEDAATSIAHNCIFKLEHIKAKPQQHSLIYKLNIMTQGTQEREIHNNDGAKLNCTNYGVRTFCLIVVQQITPTCALCSQHSHGWHHAATSIAHNCIFKLEHIKAKPQQHSFTNPTP